MFRKLKEKLFGLFGNKRKKFNKKIIRVEAVGDTRYYYRIPLGNPKVSAIASLLRPRELDDLLKRKTISFKMDGKVVRFKDSFGAILPKEEREVSLGEFVKAVKKFGNERATEDRVNSLYEMSECDSDYDLLLSAAETRELLFGDIEAQKAHLDSIFERIDRHERKNMEVI